MYIRTQKSVTHIKALELTPGLHKLSLWSKQECLRTFPKVRCRQNLGLGGLNTPYAQLHVFHFTISECVSYAVLGFPFRYFKNIKGLNNLPLPTPTIMLVSVLRGLGTTTFIYTY